MRITSTEASELRRGHRMGRRRERTTAQLPDTCSVQSSTDSSLTPRAGWYAIVPDSVLTAVIMLGSSNGQTTDE